VPKSPAAARAQQAVPLQRLRAQQGCPGSPHSRHSGGSALTGAGAPRRSLLDAHMASRFAQAAWVGVSADRQHAPSVAPHPVHRPISQVPIATGCPAMVASHAAPFGTHRFDTQQPFAWQARPRLQQGPPGCPQGRQVLRAAGPAPSGTQPRPSPQVELRQQG
jgi:hypothetical protein